jgi:hypothetical protein
VPHVTFRIELDIPADVVRLCAYFRWKERCQSAGREMHGGHEDDWYAAELEVIEFWNELSPRDIVDFAESIDNLRVDVNRAAIRDRAYYLSRRSPGVPPVQHWTSAEVEEWNIQFANMFLNFRRRVETRRSLSVFEPQDEIDVSVPA